MKLYFKGPYHKSILENLKSFPKNKNGIYIFGFIYGYDKDSTLNPKDFTDADIDSSKHIMVGKEHGQYFIPYYVGKDSNIDKMIRMKEHCDPFGSIRTTIRFHPDHMKSFFKGGNKFPINNNRSYNKKVLEWVKANRNHIVYFNCKDVLDEIYGKDVIKKAYPLNNKHRNDFQKDDSFFFLKKEINKSLVPLTDTLGDLIIQKNNLFFCYATLENASILDDSYFDQLKLSKNETNLEVFETIVFWALKGLTISKILDRKYTDPINKLGRINLDWDNNLNSIFKNEYTTKWRVWNTDISSSECFPGYDLKC